MAQVFTRLLLMLLCQVQMALGTSPTVYENTQKPIINHGGIQPRPATEADLNDFVTVFIDAFAPGPTWQYVFPHLNEYKDYYWHCLRNEAGIQFAHKPNTTFINVISIPTQSADTKSGQITLRERVVAVGVWRDLTEISEEVHRPHRSPFDPRSMYAKCSDHLEANMTRLVDFQRQGDVVEKRYIFDFPEPQLLLDLLATHPSWDGHGLGAANVQWGIEKAKELGTHIPVTLLATPAGWPLYDSLGFESMANITIKTLDDELDDLWLEYMRHVVIE
ncbi:hypothetical protein HD806DRAFT_475441 [Xylariaceae sp. AK1471]|nr:hypothetical protein HD806DRAFT_475441 [Xylariaceae sp. AK1471]